MTVISIDAENGINVKINIIKEGLKSVIVRKNTTERLSESVTYNGVIDFSGKLPADLSDSIEVQSNSVLQVLEEMLLRSGSSKKSILTAQVFLKHTEDAPVFNKIWNAWLPEGCDPTRICVQANMLNPAVLVEISLTAAAE